MDMISRLIRSRHCGAVRSPSQSELSVGSQWLRSAAPCSASSQVSAALLLELREAHGRRPPCCRERRAARAGDWCRP